MLYQMNKVWRKIGGVVQFLALFTQCMIADEDEGFMTCLRTHHRRCARLWVVVQGYGLTETCAASFLAGPFPGHSGTVGPPVPGTEYRLEGSSELGYAAVHCALACFGMFWFESLLCCPIMSSSIL